ncbi:phosphatidylinositol deacylase isoform X2 [Wolffia australiana]
MEAQSGGRGEVAQALPTSVVLVGHSMGGFVARAVVIHPRLRKSSVETVLTLSSPHQSPPVALQPSLGHLFSYVNREWQKGYEIQTKNAGRFLSDSKLSNVVVISLSGGVNDHQIRTELTSLEGIVPSTHGSMISTSSVKNVWLSLDHQSILWCNQLVIQISHTLLTIIDSGTGRPFPGAQKRLAVFTKMLQSGVSQSFHGLLGIQSSSSKGGIPGKFAQDSAGFIYDSCPPSVQWPNDALEKDLYVQSRTVTVLAMDGRRRWLDIHKLGSGGRYHFVLVTNLAPCYGIRVHLWPEKNGTSGTHVPDFKKIIEVTSRMVHIPAGPAPRQIEPGSQTEQAPPSAVLHLDQKDLRGYRFLTISVAPRPTVSGRPPPAASMAVGQFFDPMEGQIELSHFSLLSAIFRQQDMFFSEDHPLPINLAFSMSLGLLPVTLSVETVDCGIKGTTRVEKQAGDVEHSILCKLRCFPPVALAWDATSGLHIIPNLYSETIQVDSSPASWNSISKLSKTLLLLLVDPHCSYKVSTSVSLTSTASRFVLMYSPQIIGFVAAVVFFALMRQSHTWDLDLPLPSIMTAVEINLRMPFPFMFFAILPIFMALLLSLFTSQSLPSLPSFTVVSIICYLIANGLLFLLILSTLSVLYLAAFINIFTKKRWGKREERYRFILVRWISCFLSKLFSFKLLRLLKWNPNILLVLVCTLLVTFVHPSVGLIFLLLVHAYNCHISLTSVLEASTGSEQKELETSAKMPLTRHREGFHSSSTPDETRPGSSLSSGKNFADIQLEQFNHRHSLLVLHLLAAAMFCPSFAARLQISVVNPSFLGLMDSTFAVGIILHGVYGWKPGIGGIRFTFPGIRCFVFDLTVLYLLCGYYCFVYALALAPFRGICAMAALGVISLLAKIMGRGKGREEGRSARMRKHSQKHK